MVFHLIKELGNSTMLKQSFIYYFKFAKYALIFVAMRVILKIRFKML